MEPESHNRKKTVILEWSQTFIGRA